MSNPASVLHEPSDVTPAWLAAALSRKIIGLELAASQSTWGTQLQLQVRVEGEPEPLSLRVKLGDATVFGAAEVDYYTQYFVGLAGAPLVHCHHAAADATHYHLLLDDLAATHRNQFEVPPTKAYGRALVERVARLHAHHWPQSPPTQAEQERSLASAQAGLPVLLEAMREGFTAQERDRVERLMDSLPERLRQRYRDPEGFTWVHGDLNPGNILAPIQGEGELYLIDYQPFVQARVPYGLGAWDLGYAVALWWPSDARRELERDLVEHWHAALQSRGVVGYSLTQAWSDWQLCSLAQVVVPSSWCSEDGAVTKMRWVWEPQLRRVLQAVADVEAQKR